MTIQMTYAQFAASIVAQDDDNDNDESGYVACVVGDKAFIAKYGHCSCYGTWESLCGAGISDDYHDEVEREVQVTWEGSVDDLLRLAARRADPQLPQRDADHKDYNYDHLVAVYDQILAWDRKRRIAPEGLSHP